MNEPEPQDVPCRVCGSRPSYFGAITGQYLCIPCGQTSYTRERSTGAREHVPASERVKEGKDD